MPDKILVLGCGPSANLVRDRGDLPYVVGVNDARKFCKLDALVTLDVLTSFEHERRQWILKAALEEAVPWYWYQRWDIMHKCPNAQQFELALGFHEEPPIERIQRDLVPAGYICTPWVACWMAWKWGAKDIGLLGVDLTNDHQLKNHGLPLSRGFANMEIAMARDGVYLKNLSPQTKLTSPAYMPLEEWLG